MKSILNIYDLLPLFLLILQTFTFLIVTFVILRNLKILQVPYAGMQYSKVMIAAVVLFSVMMISFADVEGVVQSVKTFHSYGDGFYKNVFMKFSQFILIIVLTISLFGLLSFISLKMIPGLKQASVTEDNIPVAVLKSLVILMMGILLYAYANGIIEAITPKYINFS